MEHEYQIGDEVLVWGAITEIDTETPGLRNPYHVTFRDGFTACIRSEDMSLFAPATPGWTPASEPPLGLSPWSACDGIRLKYKLRNVRVVLNDGTEKFGYHDEGGWNVFENNLPDREDCGALLAHENENVIAWHELDAPPAEAAEPVREITDAEITCAYKQLIRWYCEQNSKLQRKLRKAKKHVKILKAALEVQS